MSWRLVREIGIDYADPGTRTDVELRFPVVVERAPGDSYLIVDEIGLGKNLTVLNECRTLRVATDGEVLFDTLRLGIDDGYGCVIDDERVAILRRTTWELQTYSWSGELLQSVDLSLVSPRLPRIVTRTPQGTFLLAFIDHVHDLDIAELDDRGQLLWYMPREQSSVVGCPTFVQQTPRGSVLIVDEFRHVATEVCRDGTVPWTFGERRNPSSAPDRLSNPMGIRELADGRRLIADTRNHRVLCVPADRRSPATELDLGELCSPTFADVDADGHTLVCDAGNGRVFELDADQNLVWEYGRRVARRRAFSFPRSVVSLPSGDLLVADTARNRVVSVTGDREDVLADERGAELFWPRCARGLADGSTLIADGRNSRIVLVGPDGRATRELRVLRALGHRGDTRLKDPHDVALLPNGHLLVTDASLDLVVEADWNGTVHWIAGDRESNALHDPHSAQLLPDGRVLIADTNAHRLAWFDRRGELVRELEFFTRGPDRLRLSRPKHVSLSDAGLLVVVDSFNNRVLAGSETGELRWELSEIPGSPLPTLNQPRWALLLAPDEVLVSDHSNHRLVHLVRDEPS